MFVNGVTRGVLWRAEKALAAAGLVEFAGSGRHRVFRVLGGIHPSSEQEQTWHQVFGAAQEKSREPRPAKPAPVLPAGSDQPDEVQLAVLVRSTTTDMSADNAAWFTDSASQMHRYLRFGLGASGKTLANGEVLLSVLSDWLVHNPSDEVYPFHKRWTTAQYCGFFWDGVCRWRDGQNLELSLPNWPQLFRQMLAIRSTRTPWKTFEYLFGVIQHLDLIRFLAGAGGQHLVLGEHCLDNDLVRYHIEQIHGHGEGWLAEQHARMIAGESPLDLDSITGDTLQAWQAAQNPGT